MLVNKNLLDIFLLKNTHTYLSCIQLGRRCVVFLHLPDRGNWDSKFRSLGKK